MLCFAKKFVLLNVLVEDHTINLSQKLTLKVRFIVVISNVMVMSMLL